ncbi:unnamed protein product [Haemonchus placei]|uniref:Cyclic nucleotide-binding domain-containing protein n=1 Tax=Haemonchus placei TaxID=6290 RepID=A0A0N4WQ20_HAEPC|nr:unnamed protein product [Haemonchus placei]
MHATPTVGAPPPTDVCLILLGTWPTHPMLDPVSQGRSKGRDSICLVVSHCIFLRSTFKEAPIMYATAVTEIVRRRTFQREFNSWFSVHVNKCCSLYDEESSTRAEFSTKMEKHFLRVLFHEASQKSILKNFPRVAEETCYQSSLYDLQHIGSSSASSWC